MMPVIEPIWLVILLMPVLYFSIFVHELGHAVLGRLTGYVVTSFGIGFAKPLFVLPVGGIRVFFCRWRSTGGLTLAFHPQILPSRWKTIGFISGGFLANLGLMILAIGLVRTLSWGQQLWIVLGLVNGLFAFGTMIPYRSKIGNATLGSDGAQIFDVLHRGAPYVPSALIVQGIESIQGLTTSIGDLVYARLNLLAGAEAWIELEDFERADLVLEQARKLPDPGFPSVRLMEQIVQAQLAIARQKPEEAEAPLNRAREIGEAEDNAVALFLVSLLHHGMGINRNDLSSSEQSLDQLRADAVARRKSAFDRTLAFFRLNTAIAHGDDREVEASASDFDSTCRKAPSATSSLRCYRGIARFHCWKANWAAAETAYRRAIASALEVAHMFVQSSEANRFLERHRGMAEEVRACFDKLGKVEEGEELLRPLLEFANPAKDLAEAAIVRNDRLRRIGLRVMLMNAAAVVLIGLTGYLVGMEFAIPSIPLVGSLAMFTLVGLGYLIFDFLIGRRVPSLRTASGAVILFFGWIPWFIGICIMIIWLVTMTLMDVNGRLPD
jgi:Peptidase family M50